MTVNEKTDFYWFTVATKIETVPEKGKEGFLVPGKKERTLMKRKSMRKLLSLLLAATVFASSMATQVSARAADAEAPQAASVSPISSEDLTAMQARKLAAEQRALSTNIESITSNFTTDSANPHENMFDGDLTTMWATVQSSAIPEDPHFEITLKQETNIEKVFLATNFGASQGVTKFSLQAWDETANDWGEKTRVYDVPWTTEEEPAEPLTIYLDTPLVASKVRFNVEEAPAIWGRCLLYELNLSSDTAATGVEVTAKADSVPLNQTLQMQAAVLPQEADQNVVWDIEDGTGSAFISEGGLVTPIYEGTVTVIAKASNGVEGRKEITITPAVAVPDYVRTYEADDTSINWQAFDGTYNNTPTIADGLLTLPSVPVVKLVDADSPFIGDSELTVRFKLSVDSGRFGFVVKKSDEGFLQVACDLNKWTYSYDGGWGDFAANTGTLKADNWYTVKITTVGKEVKVVLTDEEAGTTELIGSKIIAEVPGAPGQCGISSWYATKTVTIDSLTYKEYVDKGPSVVVDYEPFTIASEDMTVTLDNRYPTVNQYDFTSGNNAGKTLLAQDPEEYLYRVAMNGNKYEAVVTDIQKNADNAVYTLEIDALKNPELPEEGSYGKVKLEVTMKADGMSLDMVTKVLEEPEGFVLRSLEFSGQKLAAAHYNMDENAKASAAGMYTSGDWNSVTDRMFNLSDATYANTLEPNENTTFTNAQGANPISYGFISDGNFGVAVLNNVAETPSKNIIYIDVPDKKNRMLSIGTGGWDYRGPEVDINDPYQAENFPALDTMWAKVVISPDRNNDQIVDWQDAAIGYRENMEIPLGGEEIKNYVPYIMANSASQVQSDFNYSADMIKKLYNLYDGFGQMQLQKGYQAEGHDDAHNDAGGHIGIRQGGVEGFRDLLKVANEYNTKVGVHVNIDEMMLDAFYPKFDHFVGSSTGSLSKNWGWYDQAFFVDETKDLLSGELKKRFDMLKEDTTLEGDSESSLGWVYVDIYGVQGGKANWHSKQVSQMFHENGWWQATEFSGPFEQDAVWTHWGTDLHYPTSGDGSRVQRFLKNNIQDAFPANSPYVSTLLKGVQQPGVGSWQDQYDLHEGIDLFYNQNLVTKYLQYFGIMKWYDDNQKMEFENGVVSEVKDGKLYVSRNGNTYAICDLEYTSDGKFNTESDSLIFIPWNPLDETKIYHWNPDGGSTTWTLPESWEGIRNVKLYENTENGKVLVDTLPVENGQVTIDAEAKTPYVIYKDEATAGQTKTAGNWSEYKQVKDQGFDGQNFKDQDASAAWERSSSGGNVDHITYIKDQNYNNILQIGRQDAVISQEISGLTPGKDYSLSAWVQVANQAERRVTFAVDLPDGTHEEAYLTHTKEKSFGNKYAGTYFNRMRVIFTADESGTATVSFTAAAGPNADAAVLIDDVHIWEHPTHTDMGDHYYFDDFENVDMQFGAFEFGSNSSRAHLADESPDFNKGGNQYMSYVINGNYSVKQNDYDGGGTNRIQFRTRPSVLRLMPNTTYRVGMLYYTPKGGAYALEANAGTGTVLASKTMEQTGEPYAIGENGNQPDASKRKPVGQNIEIEFTTGDDPDCYISIKQLVDSNDLLTGYLVFDDFYVDVVSTTNVDTSALQSLYDQYKDLQQGDYTMASWQKFQDALAEAKGILEMDVEDLTQQMVDEYKDKLQAAVNGLTSVDKQALKIFLDIANGHKDNGDVDKLVESAKQEFLRVLDAAQRIYDDPDATQEQVDNAWSALVDIIQAVGFEKGDKTALNALVGIAGALDMADYQDGAEKDAFKEALKAARELLKDEEAMKIDLDAAYKALEDAMEKLIPAGQAVDKQQLGVLIEKAQGYDLDDYVDDMEAKEAFKTALDEAVKVYEDAGATQTEVNSARWALTEAMGALRLRADKTMLNKWLENLKAIDLSKYTEESANAVREAIAEAEALVSQDLSEADMVYIQAAIAKMISAEAALVEKGEEQGGDSGNPSETPSEPSGGHDNNETPTTGDAAPIASVSLLAATAAGMLLLLKKRKS